MKPTFLFVVLGGHIPEYFLANVRRIEQLFSKANIVIVFDSEANIPKLVGIKAKLFQYQSDKATRELLENSDLDKRFRNGFWIHTSNRLFAICQAVEKMNITNVIYLENDVLIFSNFPVKYFVELKKVAWTRFNHIRDVPAIIYIPNGKAAKFLRSSLLKEYRHSHLNTDMTAMSNVAKSFPKHFVILPSLLPEIENVNYKSDKALMENCQLRKNPKFGGIFDGAVLGMWIAGQDPRNSYGLTKYMDSALVRKDESFVDPGRCKWVFRDGMLFFALPNSFVPVFNLHVHSKDLRLFQNSSEKFLEKMVERANTGSAYARFSPSVLFFLLVDNFKSRTLLPYFVGMLRYVLRNVMNALRQFD